MRAVAGCPVARRSARLSRVLVAALVGLPTQTMQRRQWVARIHAGTAARIERCSGHPDREGIQ